MRRFYNARQGMGWPIAFSPDGKTVVACDQPGQLRRFDVATGQEIVVGGLKNDQSVALAYSPDGKKLLAAGSGRALLHDLDGKTPPLELLVDLAGEPLAAIPTSKLKPLVLAFSSDGRALPRGGTTALS